MILILLFHAKIHFGLGFHNVVIDESVSIGAVGVVGFFMISGFCLRNNYRELRYFTEGISKKRIAGIYPSFFFLLCCSLIFRYRVGDSWMSVLKILPMELSLFHVTINPLLYGYFLMIISGISVFCLYCTCYFRIFKFFISLSIVFAVLLHEIVEKTGKKTAVRYEKGKEIK